MSLAEAARIAAQSVKTIRRRVADGTLGAYRFGPRIRVRITAMLRHIQANVARHQGGYPDVRTS